MDKTIALSEVRAMRTKPISAFFKVEGPGAKVKLSEELPEDLSAAHESLSQAKVALAEARLSTARLAVKQCVDADAAIVASLVKSGKITPVVANKIVALCEKKRASQLVFLAEAMPDDAADTDGDVTELLNALGDMPDNLATENPTTGSMPGQEAGQENPAAPQPEGEEQLMAIAEQIAKEQGIPFDQALIQAEAQMKQGAGGGR